MHIYLNLTISILIIIHSKTILIKAIQTTFNLFNQLCIIVSKHKPILSKSILSESILSESIMSESILSKAEPNTHLVKIEWFNPGCEVHIGEALGLLSVLNWVHELQLGPVDFELDSKRVVDQFSSPKSDVNEFKTQLITVELCSHNFM